MLRLTEQVKVQVREPGMMDTPMRTGYTFKQPVLDKVGLPPLLPTGPLATAFLFLSFAQPCFAHDGNFSLCELFAVREAFRSP